MDFWRMYPHSRCLNIAWTSRCTYSCWITNCSAIFNRCCLWPWISFSSCSLGKMGRHYQLVVGLYLSIFFVSKIPLAERSTIPSAAQTGVNIGTIFTTPLVGIMIEGDFLGGWPSAFYVFGENDSSLFPGILIFDQVL